MIRPGKSSEPDVRIIRVEGGGSGNSSLGQRGCERMASPLIAGVKIAERKAKDTRTTRFEERYSNRSPATAPKSLLGILASGINPQAHRYRCSFHLRVFQGLSNPQGMCVHSLLF